MLYALLCDDKPNSLQLRMDTRAEHLAHLNGLGDALKFAGPFLDENDKPCGSMVVIEAESREAAKAIADRDPYAVAGLFETVTVRPWSWAIKNPAAG
ncbi:MAG: YciI-like protein [Aurantimonas endophytica]|uniref:YciI-like protein n=1 Tax=Aurantimonas endophytica TaxID=1522175 RepID=UPI003002BC6E